MSRFATMPRAYRRQQQAKDQANVDHATNTPHTDTTHYGQTAGGDARRLRGIPAIGPNVTGAIPGTRPGDTLWRTH